MRDSPLFFLATFSFIYDSYWRKIDVSYVNTAKKKTVKKKKKGTEKKGENVSKLEGKSFFPFFSSNLWQR